MAVGPCLKGSPALPMLNMPWHGSGGWLDWRVF
jgi:hypothetical protein